MTSPTLRTFRTTAALALVRRKEEYDDLFATIPSAPQLLSLTAKL